MPKELLPPDELLKRGEVGRIEAGHLDDSDDARKSCERYYRCKTAQPKSSATVASGSDAGAMLSMPEPVAGIVCNHGRLNQLRWDEWMV